ncbi:hypothetical protein LguiB_014072 [Lonicera macranthoides]
MDSDQGKLFIGGISWETSEDRLKEYFGNYGEILQAVVMRDKLTGRPRGFGFVVFSDPSVIDTVLLDKHNIDGRTVEAKRALSREEQQVSKGGNPNAGRSFGGGGGGGGGGGNVRTKKIFVGGLPPTLSEDGFRQYFEAYGHVTDVVVMYDQQTNRPRGFGFISFDSEDAVDRVLHKTFHDLNGKQVEVKRALPKDANSSGGGRSMDGGSGGGGYQGYGGSGGNSSSYEGRMDSSRYMQSQNAGGGFPLYGTQGYGYGAANNGAGYGGYGGYGGGNPGYGGQSGGAYGNPNVPNAGYGSGPQGAPRSSWGNQGSSGYGTASWGGAGGGSGGPASAPAGQSPSGATSYGNQGYGGYGGTEGSYGNPAAYGAVGGRIGGAPNSNYSAGSGAGGELQSGGGGYMGGGYGDGNGNSAYGSQGWRSDPSQANYGAQANSVQVGYGGGYGGAPARQAQQQ